MGQVRYATWKNDYYRQLLGEMSPSDLSAEVKSTLDELRARGYLLTIGSSSKNTKYILQRLGLEGYFDAISGVEAAHAAGMKAAVVGDAAENKAGDYILESFSELLKLLPGVE